MLPSLVSNSRPQAVLPPQPLRQLGLQALLGLQSHCCQLPSVCDSVAWAGAWKYF